MPPSSVEEGGGGSAGKARGQHPQGEEAEAGEACAFKTWPATPQAEFLARAVETSGREEESEAAAAAEVRGVRKGSRMLPEVAGVGDRQGGQSAIQAATLAQSQPLDMRLQQDAASLGGRREARAVKRAGTTERTSSQEAVEELERRSQEEGQRRGCRRGPISGEKKAKE